MRTLTATQQAALERESQRVAWCVKIDRTGTDLLYTSWSAQVTVDSVTYTPRGLRIQATSISDLRRSRASVEIEDLDGTIAAAWYGERFSGATVTLTEALYQDGAWVTVRTIPWVCSTSTRGSDGVFRLELSGAGGLRPRAGLKIGTRADFHLAPEPGASFRVGPSVVRLD